MPTSRGSTTTAGVLLQVLENHSSFSIRFALLIILLYICCRNTLGLGGLARGVGVVNGIFGLAFVRPWVSSTIRIFGQHRVG